MNRYLNKALIYKEWLAVRWIVLLMGLANLFLVIIPMFENVTFQIKTKEVTQGSVYINLSSSLYSSFEEYLLMYSGLILLLCFLLFNLDRLSTTYSVTASMPFTRKQLIFSKCFVGLSSIIALQFVNFIFINAAFLLYKSSYLPNSYLSALHWITFMLFFNIVLFSFAMLIQTLMGNAMAAAPITAVLLVAPLFIVTAAAEILRLHVGDVKIMTQMLNIIDKNMIDSLQPKYVDMNSIGFQYLGVIAAVFISFSIVFIALSFYAYQKNPLERNGEIVLFSGLERFFIFGVALCLGLLMSLVIGEGILNIYNTNIRTITVDVLLVTFFIAGYWGTKKLLNIAKQN